MADTTQGIDRWRGRVALVTGASSGIGESVANRLVEHGVKVVGCARRVERLHALKNDLGSDFLPLEVDLRDEKAIATMFSAIRERWGGVDILINNAGLGHRAPLLSGSTEEWREMLEVNILALCVCTREAVSDMRRRGDDGQVIHISSMSAHRVPDGSGVYSGTKHAVKALTEALRRELHEAGSGVRVAAVSPGFVETEFAELFAKSKSAAEKTYGRYPVLQPQDIADLVETILASPPHMAIHDVLVRPRDQKS
jgi:17beta-estradiol 17-dehydrogenase / 3beta-hydroxysteroid 3-dehydrogenase